MAKDIIYGDKDVLGDEEFNDVKVRITHRVDVDALKKLKAISKARGVKHQTLLNEVIRDFVNEEELSQDRQLTEMRLREVLREELKAALDRK